MKYRASALAFLFLSLTLVLAPALQAEETPAQTVELSDLLSPAEVVWVSGDTCVVTLQCQYPPPSSVSCSSPNGDCHSNSTSVTCDGVTTSCSSGCPVSCAFRNGRFCSEVWSTSLCNSGQGYCETCVCGPTQRWECG
jgi:hypothetical protein